MSFITPPVYSPTFEPHKAAQAAAYFLHQAQSSLDVIKLVKLMYLAERESLLKYSEPLFSDCLVSMPHGPVVSSTYNQINGAGDAYGQSIWEEWIDARANHKVALNAHKNTATLLDSLLALSESDLDVLASVQAKYGGMDTWYLRDLTHTAHIPEWLDPQGSSAAISYQTLFIKNGKTREEAQAIIARLIEQSEQSCFVI